MPYLIALILGLALGWVSASKKGGNLADKLQYATIYAMIALVLTLIALVIYGNMM